MADVCLAAAWRWARGAPRAALRRARSAPTARRTGLAVIGMGKLGGEELNYSSDIDLDLRLRRGRRDRGRRARAASPTASYFAQAVRSIVDDARVGHRGGPRLPRGPAPAPRGALGRADPVAGRLSRLLRRPRRALGAAGPHQGAPLRGRRGGGRRASSSWSGPSSSGPASTRPSCARVREHEAARSTARSGPRTPSAATSSSAAAASARWSSSSRRCSSSTAGDDPWLRERNSLRAIFRLTERGYLSHALGPRCWATRSSTSAPSSTGCRSSTSSRPTRLPEEPRALGPPRPPHGRRAQPPAAARAALHGRAPARDRAACTAAFREFFDARRRPRAARPLRIPSYTALKATGFTDPDRARQNLRLVLEGRPLIPYPAAARPRAGPPASRCCSTRSGRARIPTRPSTSSSASSPRRDRAPPTSSSWPTARSCSPTWSGSARGASC